MEEISTVGIDLAKSVFQVHAIDPVGNVIVRRQLRRQQMLKFFEQLKQCLIGMEACGTAHYWARASNDAGLCETFREAAEERYRRCGGDL
jgi:transposase